MMKNSSLTHTLILLIACLALAFGSVACGDDDATESTNANNTNSNTNNPNTNTNNPNTNTNNPNTTTGGVCGDGNIDAGEQCDGGDACQTDCTLASTEVTFPGTPEEYASSAKMLSYMNTLSIPGLDPETDEPLCCKNFGSISRFPQELDNTLAILMPTIEGFLPANEDGTDASLNGIIQDQIEAGTLAIIWDHLGLTGDTDADGFVLAGLLGAFAPGTDYAKASGGTGEFTVNLSSFKSGGEPLITFNPVSMDAGSMQAGPGPFNLTLPLFGINLSLNISEAEITGNATVGADGVDYVNGTISGYIKDSDLFGALNVVAETCDCLGVTGDMIIDDGGWKCSPDVNFAACETDAVEICASLSAAGAICDALPVINSVVDIDSDGDGTFDSLSVGLEWTGASTSITGVTPPVPTP